MPHFIVEYTANLAADMRTSELLKKGIRILTADGYPLHGMRARAIAFSEYELADGRLDYAMVHATLRLAPGHTVEEKTRIFEAVFAMMKEHFADVFSRRLLMMSLELQEIFGANGRTLRQSNVTAELMAKNAILP